MNRASNLEGTFPVAMQNDPAFVLGWMVRGLGSSLKVAGVGPADRRPYSIELTMESGTKYEVTIERV